MKEDLERDNYRSLLVFFGVCSNPDFKPDFQIPLATALLPYARGCGCCNPVGLPKIP